MAYVYERTHDPLFLAMPQEMAAAGSFEELMTVHREIPPV